MKLKTWVGANSGSMTSTLVIGQWVTVYVAYSITQGTYGVSQLFLNGGMNDGFASMNTQPNSTALSASDTVKIGGGFTGQLRRLQVYSPAAFSLSKDSGKLFYLKEKIFIFHL